LQSIVFQPLASCDRFLHVPRTFPLQIPLVGLGTPEALHAIQADPQLANRFTPVVLPPWRRDREFLRLLASFEQILPLRRPSRLIAEPLARTLLALSEGSLGDLVALLTAAAIAAIRSGVEQITAQVLAELDWIPPSQRGRAAARQA
jgi:hypothetical protein